MEALLQSMEIDQVYMDSLETVVNKFREEKESVKRQLLTTSKMRLNNIENNMEKIQDRIFKTGNDMLISQYEAQLIKL